MDARPVEDPVDEDMDNVLGLLHEFNNGAHGHPGRFAINELGALRITVNPAIGFIHKLCAL